MSTDYRILQFIQRHQRANWYALRHLDLEPYGTPVAALQGLARKGLIEQEVEQPAGTYTLTSVGAGELQAHQDKLAAQLQALQQDNIDTDTARQILLDIGEEQYREALHIVERFIANPNHSLHATALQVLVGIWNLTDDEYQLATKRLIEEDENPPCHLTGVVLLARLAMLKKELAPETLSTLAQVVHNIHEDSKTRVAAYRGMKTILGLSTQEQTKLLAANSLDEIPDVDWALVHTYLDEDSEQ